MGSLQLTKICNFVAALVRGPFFLAVLSLVLLVAAVPAQAVLLKGYLQQDGQTAQANSDPLKATVELASFPEAFEGVWQCITVVVDSAVGSVQVGQQTQSQVAFVKSDGRVVAHWAQPGWTEAQSSIIPISDCEAAIDRTNYFVNGGGWSARSVDHYRQLESDRMVAVSEIDQYVAGQYLGKYRTKSVLLRMAQPQQNMAMVK